jgi:hypothetical protein
VSPTGPVEEVKVQVHRLAVPRQPSRHAPDHLVEVHGLVSVGAASPERPLAGHRRHEHLGLEPGGDDLRRDGRGHRQHALFDEEHVGVERGPLVPGPDVLNDPGDAQRSSAGHVGVDDDRVVELEVRVGSDAHPEGQGRRVFGTQDHPDGLAHAPAVRVQPGRRAGGRFVSHRRRPP